MKRIEIHSHEPRVNVYLTSANLERDKRYKLAIEKLSVPAVESRILNAKLFEVKRRIRVPGVAVDFDEDDQNEARLETEEEYRAKLVADVYRFIS